MQTLGFLAAFAGRVSSTSACSAAIMSGSKAQSLAAAALQLFKQTPLNALEYHTSRPGLADEPTAPTASTPTSTNSTSTSARVTPLQNPLQAILTEKLGPQTALTTAAGPGRPKLRTWLWYDERDERRERQKEWKRQYPDAGTVHMQGIPQSMKKLQRIIRLVRGLHVQEAIKQCKLVPHKAAGFVLEALEDALEDAKEKGLDCELLVVDTIFVTKGITIKDIQPMGKGIRGKKYTRHSHLRVVLTPDPQYNSFRARLVAPIMGRLNQGAHAKPRRLLHRVEV